MAADCLVPVYLEASWKGIPFHIESSSDSFGRRGDSYQFPLSETIAYKDLGRKPRRFKLDGYLIGGDQIELTVALARAAESREPGTLVHPMFGRQQVACVLATFKIDYKTDKRRTKVDFDFLEANYSAAPYAAGTTVAAMMELGTATVEAAEEGTEAWDPTTDLVALIVQISLALADLVAPAKDEDSWDVIDLLHQALQTFSPPPMYGGAPETMRAINWASIIPRTSGKFSKIHEAVEPINLGTAQIRLLHSDARTRLMHFNSAIVDYSQGVSSTDSVEAFIIAARLSMIRDFVLVAMQTNYNTVKEALDDLDWAIRVYDEEELAAAQRNDDPLVSAIRTARAAAIDGMLKNNIRLPGLVDFNVGGVWPSLVIAQKLYGDGTRYEDAERYSPQQPPWFIGRDAVAPADQPAKR